MDIKEHPKISEINDFNLTLSSRVAKEIVLSEQSSAQLRRLFEKVDAELTTNTEEQFIKARIKDSILSQLAGVELPKEI